jgi:hypothetical protein
MTNEERAAALAAEHWPTVGYCFSLYSLDCSCGQRLSESWKYVDIAKLKAAWQEHVRKSVAEALSAQASESPANETERAMLDMLKSKIVQEGYELAKSILIVDAYLGGNVSQLKPLVQPALSIVDKVENAARVKR